MSNSLSVWDKCQSLYNDAKVIYYFFNNQYKVLPALTPAQEQEAFKIRHTVYCEELNYVQKNSWKLEKDEHDGHSTQLMLYYRPENRFIGCTRFIHGQIEDGQKLVMPFEQFCAETLDWNKVNEIKASGYRYAEISRLIIEKNFRHAGRCKVGKVSPTGSSCAMLAMLFGIQSYAKASDTKYLFAIVEKRLWNCFQRLSIPTVAMGDPVDHKGMRYPIMLDRDEIEKIVPFTFKKLYEHSQHQMNEHIDFWGDLRENFVSRFASTGVLT